MKLEIKRSVAIFLKFTVYSFGFLLISFVLLASSYWNLTKHPDFLGVILMIFGIPSFFIFSLAFFYGIKMLFTFKPLIIIDEKGITDNYSFFKYGLIPWNHIKNINISSHPIELGKTGMIQFNPNFPGFKLELHHNDEVLKNYKGIKRFLLKSRLKNGQPMIFIPRKTLHIQNEQNVFEIMKFHFIK